MAKDTHLIEQSLRVLSENPDDFRNLLIVGDLLLNDGDPAAAVGYYARAVDVFEARGDWVKAHAVQRQVLSLLRALPGTMPSEVAAAARRADRLQSLIRR